MNCPVCTSNESLTLEVINTTGSVSHVLKNADPRFESLKAHISQLWKAEECVIRECRNCGLVYAAPFVAGDAKFYNIVYSDSRNYSEWTWEHEMTYRLLKQGTTENSSLLEIGAGTGSFVMKIAEELIPAQNIECTEYSDFGKSLIEKAGIRCYQSDIRDDAFEGKERKYDIVCMFQVLEHLDNLTAFFEKLNTVTNSSAQLFIAVPNNVQRKIYADRGINLDIPPTHITRWNYKSIQHIADKFGWNIADHKLQPQKPLLTVYRYIQLYFQRKYSSAQKIESIPNSLLRKSLKFSFYAYIFLLNLAVIPRLYSSDLGVAQWYHLTKKNS